MSQSSKSIRELIVNIWLSDFAEQRGEITRTLSTGVGSQAKRLLISIYPLLVKIAHSTVQTSTQTVITNANKHSIFGDNC